MNLLEQLKKEVYDLNLTSKKEIAYYLYIRTGEIFDFDPTWEITSSQGAKEIMERKFDLENITSRLIVCKSWAVYIYQRLLNEFGIKAEAIGVSHVKVEFYDENNDLYVADLMNLYGDITSIKFGMAIQYFYKKGEYKNQDKDLERKIHYLKGIKPESVLNTLYKELNNLDISNEEYVNKVCELIVNILNVPRPNVGFISGREYINYLFYFFDVHVLNAELYNLKKEEYKEVYMLENGGLIKFFLYQKMANNFYELHEKNTKEMNELLEQYEEPEGVLKLSKSIIKRKIQMNEK